MWRIGQPWPTIGFVVVDFIESELVHGPGPMQGESPTLTDEEVRFILHAYEVHPQGDCGRKGCPCAARVGQFRYGWNDYVRLKGARKSELAAWLAHAELWGPCRFAGWDAAGEPVAAPLAAVRGTADVPFAATSEDQAGDTAWSSFHDIAQHCAASSRLDVTSLKVIDQVGGGNARVVTSSSIARDGGRPTSTVIEEPHLWYSRELRDLFKTMDRNMAKLHSSDPHGFKVSTMFRPGQHSVLEDDYDAAQTGDDSINWDHRGATGKLDPKNDADVMAGVIQAIGDAKWLDPERITRQFKRDRDEGVRYWWNRRSLAATAVVDPEEWAALAQPREVEAGEPIVLGFDGSLFDDCTALTARCLTDGYSFPLGIWQPSGADDGVFELHAQVSAALAEAASKWTLVLMLCDPPYWHEQMAEWQALYGQKVVQPYWTNRDMNMAWATHRWSVGITTGAWRHSGDPTMASHVGHAHKRMTRTIIDGSPAWVPTKDRHHSVNKIDACVTDILSHEARFIAIGQGALQKLSHQVDSQLYTF